jgi:hypothetical protein
MAATRSSAHARDEKAVFGAFLAAHPTFAATVEDFRQPDDEFQNVVAVLRDDSEIDFVLGEWLDGTRMATAKRYDGLANALLDAIRPQEPNLSRHFRAVMPGSTVVPTHADSPPSVHESP